MQVHAFQIRTMQIRKFIHPGLVLPGLVVLLSLLAACGQDTSQTTGQPGDLPTGAASNDVRQANIYALDCNMTVGEAAASGAPRLNLGDTSFYIGSNQVSSNNQDPRLLRFDAGKLSWCRDDLETSGDDGRGYGLLWTGTSLYAVFTATGNQGEAAGDFRRFATKGWLTSYANSSRGGGGPKVTVLTRIDPADGNVLAATYLTAVRPSDRKINSLTATDLSFNQQQITVQADAFYSPRQTNKAPFTCTGSSPFRYRVTLNAELSAALAASADRCQP